MDLKSANYFMKTDKLNCAQSVLKYFEKYRPIDVETMKRFAKCGGGNADGGVCGALYAAIHLADKPATIIKLKQEFNGKAGCITCKGIKQKKIMSCNSCVDLAVDILINNLDGGE